MLQSDTVSLSLVIPALVNVTVHLSKFSQSKGYKGLAALSLRMKANVAQRFSHFLEPDADNFSPLVAATCLLDLTVEVDTHVENKDQEFQDLLRTAEDYVISTPTLSEDSDDETTDAPDGRGHPPSAIFLNLSEHLN